MKDGISGSGDAGRPDGSKMVESVFDKTRAVIIVTNRERSVSYINEVLGPLPIRWEDQ